jgi:hypothetical protein
MQNFKKKLETIKKDGLEPLAIGMKNFKFPKQEVEILAKQRTDTCIYCEKCTDEPIPIFRVEDENIKILSNKICNDCGCTLSYKTRQSLKKCERWKE